MKQTENRGRRDRIIAVMRFMRLKLRSTFTKDGSLMLALLTTLSICLCLSLSADASDVPYEVSRGKTMLEDSSGNMDDLVVSPADANVLAPQKLIAVSILPKANFEALYTAEVPAMTSITTTTTEATSETTTTTTSTSTEETWFIDPTEEVEPYVAVPVTEVATEYVGEYYSEPETITEYVEEAPMYTEGSVYDYVSEEELIMLAKTVAQEGGDCSYTQQACVIWTVLNRVDSPEWPNTISENLTRPAQFAYYPDKNYRDDHYQVAYDQVYNWLFGGERYLSGGYQYFYGDGRRNHFYGNGCAEYCPD